VGGQEVLLCSFPPPLFVFPCPLSHISILSLPIGVPGVFALALVTLRPRLILTSEPRRINIVRATCFLFYLFIVIFILFLFLFLFFILYYLYFYFLFTLLARVLQVRRSGQTAYTFPAEGLCLGEGSGSGVLNPRPLSQYLQQELATYPPRKAQNHPPSRVVVLTDTGCPLAVE
jgi:hypothetical protein